MNKVEELQNKLNKYENKPYTKKVISKIKKLKQQLKLETFCENVSVNNIDSVISGLETSIDMIKRKMENIILDKESIKKENKKIRENKRLIEALLNKKKRYSNSFTNKEDNNINL